MSRSKQTVPAKVHTINDLEQVKVLADPLRLRILEPLCEQARTTKQVAEILGEKPSKLYHHVDALERVGLIRLEKTQQKRGTLEKYYRAIATSFRTDPELFTSGAGLEEDWAAMGANVLQAALDELRGLKPADPEPPENAIVVSARLRAPRAEIEAFHGKLEALVEEMMADESEEIEADYRFAVAFFPLSTPDSD